MSNIIRAVFCNTTSTSASGLYQYDYGQILKFEGIDLPSTYEVHFCNEGEDETITVLGNADGVEIPDQFLTDGAAVRAWVFLHTGNDDGETEYAVRMPVTERPQPSDIQPTPVQQDIITQAIAALNTAVTETSESAQAAAAGSAQAASTKATEASNSAQTAAGSATAAGDSATAAAGSASTAQTAAQTATTKASEASASATAANTAKTDAQTARTGAQTAQTAAETAQANAETAAASVSASAAQIAQNTEDITGLKNDLNQSLLVKSAGKNLYNPANNMANTRMYNNAVGQKMGYTTQNGMNLQKIAIDPAKTYTLYSGTCYAVTDADDIIVIQYTSMTEGVATTLENLPSNARYLWYQANDNQALYAQVEEGNKRTAYAEYDPYAGYSLNGSLELMAEDIPLVSKMTFTPFSPDMTKKEFATAHNNLISTLAATSLCAPQSFFPIKSSLTEVQLTWAYIFDTINKNMRDDVVSESYSLQKNCDRLNKALANRIYRFEDAKLNDGAARDFSLTTGFQADEPSAIVSDDGEKLYIYAHLKRIETSDGVNWSEPINTPLSDSGYILHNNVAYINGVYYMTGTTSNSLGDLALYTSTDGINFTYKGILFKENKELASGHPVLNWGNSYLFYEYGSNTFYLYVETQSQSESWVINLATCTNILAYNQDGTIGNWVIEPSNPVIEKPFLPYTNNTNSAGNPDFARGSDNRPVRHNGKWYMYFHSTHSQTAHILRASSTDLVNWDVDGITLDVRDTPTGGDNTSGNADASIIEFKGRTYFFYTWDINNPNASPYIKYLIDDRSITEIIKIRP